MKMRHVLVHDYFQIDENAVFYVIEDDLPPLREHIDRYLTDTNWNEWEKIIYTLGFVYNYLDYNRNVRGWRYQAVDLQI